MLRNKRSHHNEKPTHCNEDPTQPKINKFKKKKHYTSACCGDSVITVSFLEQFAISQPTMPRTLQTLSHLILTAMLWDQQYSSYFINKEMEA